MVKNEKQECVSWQIKHLSVSFSNYLASSDKGVLVLDLFPLVGTLALMGCWSCRLVVNPSQERKDHSAIQLPKY